MSVLRYETHGGIVLSFKGARYQWIVSVSNERSAGATSIVLRSGDFGSFSSRQSQPIDACSLTDMRSNVVLVGGGRADTSELSKSISLLLCDNA